MWRFITSSSSNTTWPRSARLPRSGRRIAVYGAVHDVNAYTWETAERTFTTHHQRRLYVTSSVFGLSSIAAAYQMLQGLAFQARYMPGFTLTPEGLKADLSHLQRIAETVCGMLGVALKI